MICRSCDHGNRYCGPECAALVRRDSLRADGATYQATDIGRKNHAARQQRYLERQEAKMTPHSSTDPDACSSEQETCADPAPDTPTSPAPERIDARPTVPQLTDDDLVITIGPAAALRADKSYRWTIVRCHFCGRICGLLSRPPP